MLICIIVLAGLMKKQLVEQVMAAAIELARKGKTVQNVDPSTLALLGKPHFEMSTYIVEGLIESA